MALRVAQDQMLAAKQRCGNVTQGRLWLTEPNPEGIYYAVFENDLHGDAFRRFLDLPQTRVTYQVLNSLPPGVSLQKKQTIGDQHAAIIRDLMADIFDPDAINEALRRRSPGK